MPLLSDMSVVEYFAGHDGYRCGYCKSDDTNYSHGMWAHSLTVQDYQDLIDRGWRRSGQYCYKPTLNKTCCPMYTIKCHAMDFQMSKSHKKVIKKFNKFVMFGVRQGGGGDSQINNEDEEFLQEDVDQARSKKIENKIKLGKELLNLQCDDTTDCDKKADTGTDARNDVENVECSSADLGQQLCSQTTTNKAKLKPGPGLGPDPKKPKAMKAKAMRKERRRQRLAEKGMDIEDKIEKKNNQEKTIEDWLNIPCSDVTHCHQFRLRLVKVGDGDPVYKETFSESHALYQKYQVAIHGDSPDKCNVSQFKRFLCKSPLIADGQASYGSYHQHYLLDGKIIAVGVVDILPRCVSSVYLYYDPEFHFLSLGTYTSLQEIAFVRKLSLTSPGLVDYYLGFYIHSCPKMRYKGQYRPSYLVCPESYVWQSIEYCRPLLDKARYSRLDPDAESVDNNQLTTLDNVKILFMREIMPWPVYRAVVQEEDQGSGDDTEEVTEYAGLVGQCVADRMILYRSGR